MLLDSIGKRNSPQLLLLDGSANCILHGMGKEGWNGDVIGCQVGHVTPNSYHLKAPGPPEFINYKRGQNKKEKKEEMIHVHTIELTERKIDCLIALFMHARDVMLSLLGGKLGQ